MGPTTSGKTTLAIALSKKIPIEIISVDSTAIYCDMNIGTAKPTLEEQKIAPHRLIDIIDPAQSYSVANFRKDALLEIEKITKIKRIPVLVGGTMLYFYTLLNGLTLLPSANKVIRININNIANKVGWNIMYKYLQHIDPIASSKIHPNDHQRLSRALEIFFISGKTLTELNSVPKETLPYKVFIFTILPKNRQIFYKNIENRFITMLKNNFENEVRKLYMRTDLHENLPSMRSIGYRQMWLYLSGKINYNEMIYRSICATYQLAKHQITWLKKWKNIHQLHNENINQQINQILTIMNL